MPLTLARAKFMLKHKVAGIVITPHMLQVLQQEKEQGLSDRVYVRCALQILMCRHLGFAGCIYRLAISLKNKAYWKAILKNIGT
jgi:methylenetetrahydrofolate reductase (NADPH)